MVRVISGRYRLIAELGRGGMGVVWRAHDERIDRDVALKLLHPWIADDADSQARFDREARALGRLTHANIVRVYDFGEDEDEGATFLVLELVEGVGLDEIAERAPIPWKQVRSLVTPVAAALAYAHEHGIVHRDLKPANVLVEHSGRVVVSDFGLARLAEGVQSITQTGVLIGSPEYWAPEQASGKPVTPASDIYALGCMLYQLLTGRLPFEGDNRLAVGYRRVHEDVPDPRTHAPDLDTAAVVLLLRLLARDPEARPSAAAVHAQLARRDDRETPETVLAPAAPTLPAQTEPLPTVAAAPTMRAPPTDQPVTATNRSRRLLLWAALGVLALGGAAVALIALRPDDPTRVAETAQPTQVRTAVVTETAEAPPTTVVVTREIEAPPPPSPSGPALTRFGGSYFTVGYPRGWVVAAAEESKGGYLDTTIHHPARRSTFIRVDVSPGIGGSDPAVHARAVERVVRRQSGYRQIAFSRTTFNGYEALRWEFVVPESGVLLRKVDVFFIDGDGNGFAVLTQSEAAGWPGWRRTFERVSASVAPAFGTS